MIPKQDRQGVRKATDIEQKYGLSQDYNDVVIAASVVAAGAKNAAETAAAAVQKAQEVIADASGWNSFMRNLAIDYAYDEATGANYTVIRIFRDRIDGAKQFPFVYAPNGAGGGRASTLDMNAADGWYLAINAGAFDPDALTPLGIVIENGAVIQNAVHGTNQPLTIDAAGNLGYAASDADAEALVSGGVISAVCGFAPIIDGYVAVLDYPDETNASAQERRQIIGQFGNGDYAIVTCEGGGYQNSDGWTIAEAQAVCKKLGLKFAYNLDGGGSVETVLGLKSINTIYENETGRIVPTYIVFNGTSDFVS